MEVVVGTISAIALALFAWASIFVIVPSCRTSLFRYKLWDLRDEIADEVRAGKYEDPEHAKELVGQFERWIRWAPSMTAFNMGLVLWARHGTTHRPADQRAELLSGLGPRDTQRYNERLATLDHLTLRHVIFDSPSGWIFLVSAFVVALFREAASDHRRSPEHSSVLRDAKQRVSEEVRPDIYVEGAEKFGKRHAREPLSLQI